MVPFGIASAPKEYQGCIRGVQGVAVDLLCVGKGKTLGQVMTDHDKNLIALLDRCCKKNIKLNAKKMKSSLSEVLYSGHLLTTEGLKPDQNKVKDVSEMPEPTDV